MADLFDQDAPQSKHAGNRPLADRCRPTKITDVIGQQKLIGSDGSITIMLESGNLPSIIFWGPPGVGKTTIARLLASEVNMHFVQMSAIYSGVSDLKKQFEAAILCDSTLSNALDGVLITCPSNLMTNPLPTLAT
jgi:putative ATPase